MKKTDAFFNIIPKTTDVISKHDLVFGSPVNDPIAGIPIGDGDTGSLIWFENDGIHININKTDLWDFSSNQSDFLCSQEDEDLTSLRHGGELVIKFNSPCFDMIYQKDFEARLSLSDATMYLQSQTEFFNIKAECFASCANKVTALKCSFTVPEPENVNIKLTRWGSRNSWRWYAIYKRDSLAGLNGTRAHSDYNRLYITQELNGTFFCLGVAIVSDNEHSESVINTHTASSQIKTDNKGGFTLYWNISLGENTKQAKQKTDEALSSALNVGFEELHRKHTDEWASFWNKSFVSIPHDYIENCYYLSLYYSNSECRGAYPPHFTNGVWGFYHDYLPWNYYFHYNMQHMYAPLEPSGHGELAENYYKLRRKGLENACRYAEEIKGKKGALYHDVCDCLGRYVNDNEENCTPGPEVAIAMYRHYRMNGDRAFLENVALPVMKKTAEFYLSILKKEDDGLYHTHNTSVYEGTPLLKDSITDLVTMKALFTALLNCGLCEEERSAYEDALVHLSDYNLVQMDDDEICDGRLAYGIGKGKKRMGDGRVFTVGIDSDGNPVRRSFGSQKQPFYGFPDTEMSPIYPSGVFGLKDKNSPLFPIMLDQIRLHPHPKDCIQWCMMPIYMARMGMAEELYENIEQMISSWILFPNGFSVDCPEGIEAMKNPLRYNYVNETTGKPSCYRLSYPFRHFAMEALPIVASAVCESLLQSYDGVLRICPAVLDDASVMFCLYGEDGFCVKANKEKEKYRIIIENLHGNECFVSLSELPQDGMSVYIKKLGCELQKADYNFVKQGEEMLIRFNDFCKGDSIIITNFDGDVSPFAEIQKNTEWKTCGNVHLGTPHTY